MMEGMQFIFRWLHVFVGIIWIGHLYFFNFVNAPLAAKLDGPTKQKVVPEAHAAGALLVPVGRRLDLDHRGSCCCCLSSTTAGWRSRPTQAGGRRPSR